MELDVAKRGLLLSLALVLLGASSCSSPSRSGEAPPQSLADAVTRFAVVGDYGSTDETERAVAAQLKTWSDDKDANALVTTGDNAYPYSTPDTLEAAWAPFYGWANDELSVIATLGNHDVQGDGGESTITFFGLADAWYQTTSGNVDFFVLDANRPEEPEQTAWLREALAQSEADWKVVVFHQPAFSCSEHDGDSRIVEQWVPVFEEFGVDLTLSGHDHNYQRFVAGSTTYVVAGGGGAALYGLDECPAGSPPRVAANDQQHHFLGVEASHEEMLVQVIDPQGQVLDTFSLRN